MYDCLKTFSDDSDEAIGKTSRMVSLQPYDVLRRMLTFLFNLRAALDQIEASVFFRPDQGGRANRLGLFSAFYGGFLY